MDQYNIFKRGSAVEVFEGDDFLVSGTIVTAGTNSVEVVDSVGDRYAFPYPMLRQANYIKTAGSEIIKEETNNGKHFSLVKDEVNTDGTLSVVYRVLVDDKPVQESEEIVLNVYSPEFGWSEPDDFDEQKVELLKSTYESGFDLLVESYDNIEKNIMEVPVADTPTAPAEPTGKPAFVPGVTPKETPSEGVESTEPTTEALIEESPTEQQETPTEGVETVGASLHKTSFSRSILAAKIDDRLHGNPQNRLDPILRSEMQRRGIPADTNSLELADRLKDFDFGGSAHSKTGSKKLAMEFTSIDSVLNKGELDISELQRCLRLSIAAEQDAVALYQTIADSTTNEDIKAIFNEVAADECRHIGSFQEILNIIDDSEEDNASLLEEGADEAINTLSIGAAKEKPSIFGYTIYRLPNEEELVEFSEFPNLTAKEVFNGFGYTMIGRGVPNNENVGQIKEGISMLIDCYPENPVYAEALELANEKY